MANLVLLMSLVAVIVLAMVGQSVALPATPADGVLRLVGAIADGVDKEMARRTVQTAGGLGRR